VNNIWKIIIWKIKSVFIKKNVNRHYNTFIHDNDNKNLTVHFY
jgi:hypothetical protein